MTAATLLRPEILKAVIRHASPKTSKTQLQSMIGCVKIELVYVKTRKQENPRGILCQFMTVFVFFLRNREIQSLYLILQLKGPVFFRV